MKFFGVSLNTPAPSAKGSRPVPSQLLSGREGALCRWRKELQRFEMLWNDRQVFREGVRGASVYLYSTFLTKYQKYSGISDSEVTSKVNALFPCLEQVEGTKVTERAVNGKPRAYTWSDFQRTLSRESLACPSHKMISELLRITPEESKLTGWPVHGAEVTLSREAKRKMRRQLIRSWFVDDGELPIPVRDLCTRICNHDPRLKCALATVSKDYNNVMNSASKPLFSF